MGNPRSLGRGRRMAGLAVTGAPVRTLTLAAAVLGAGVSFALVAGAVGLFKPPILSTTQSALLDSQPAVEGSLEPLAEAQSTTPGLSPGAAAAPAAAAGAATAPTAGAELSRAQAIALVQGRYRARVVRTSLLQDKSGRRLYVFRLLSGSGKVWTVRIDAQSGAEVP